MGETELFASKVNLSWSPTNIEKGFIDRAEKSDNLPKYLGDYKYEALRQRLGWNRSQMREWFHAYQAERRNHNSQHHAKFQEAQALERRAAELYNDSMSDMLRSSGLPTAGIGHKFIMIPRPKSPDTPDRVMQQRNMHDGMTYAQLPTVEAQMVDAREQDSDMTSVASRPRDLSNVEPLTVHRRPVVEATRDDSPDSTASLGPVLQSPTVNAAMEFYRDYGQTSAPIPRARTVRTGRGLLRVDDDEPRRHSMLPSPGQVTASFAKFGLQSPARSARGSRRGSDEFLDDNIPSNGSVGDRMSHPKATPTSVPQQMENLESDEVTQRIANPLDPRGLGAVPYMYANARLQKWGTIYMGNTETADAFIKAVPLVEETSPNEWLGQLHRAVSVRVLPRAKSRRPFLLKKTLRVARAPSPASTETVLRAGASSRAGRDAAARVTRSRSLRASHRIRSNSSPASRSNMERMTSTGTATKQKSRLAALPIHIEYALYRTPLLAAIMLSGPVRKGDILELPMPHPEAWPAVVEWMYSVNKSHMTHKVRENILYLGGTVEGEVN